MTVVMGIETSCDETGVGFVRDGVLLGDAVASSMAEHARFGGVVPDIAARAPGGHGPDGKYPADTRRC